MKLTNVQIDFVLRVQTLYDELLPPDAVDMLPLLFEASARQEDLEVARLVGIMIIEMALSGREVEPLASDWLAIFSSSA